MQHRCGNEMLYSVIHTGHDVAGQTWKDTSDRRVQLSNMVDKQVP